MQAAMGTPEAKRKADEVLESGEGNGSDAPVVKRMKVDGGSNGGAAEQAAAIKPKPAIDLSVLEKAKKALQLQKELKEKMKKLQVG